MIDINELRRLVQAATPGPWKLGQYLGSPRQFVIHMDVGDKGRGSDVAFTSAAFGNDETIANASFIAAANPDAISELLDRLEAAEKDIALKERIIDSLGSELNAVANERDDLQAKIEAMERQKPVGEIQRANSTGNYICSEVWVPLPVGSKLYALPGAQPAPSVPEGWKLVPIEPTPEMIEAASGYHSLVMALRAAINSATEAKP